MPLRFSHVAVDAEPENTRGRKVPLQKRLFQVDSDSQLVCSSPSDESRVALSRSSRADSESQMVAAPPLSMMAPRPSTPIEPMPLGLARTNSSKSSLSNDPAGLKKLRCELDSMGMPSLRHLRNNFRNRYPRTMLDEKRALQKAAIARRVANSSASELVQLRVLQAIKLQPLGPAKPPPLLGLPHANACHDLHRKTSERSKAAIYSNESVDQQRIRGASFQKNSPESVSLPKEPEGIGSPRRETLLSPRAVPNRGKTSVRHARKTKRGRGGILETGPGEAELRQVFQQLKMDGEVHQDELPHGLELLGYMRPDLDLAAESIKSVTTYSTLSFVEFKKFVQAYDAGFRDRCYHMFVESDHDKSGELSITELRGLLKRLGFVPMVDALEEATAEIDRDSTGEMSFPEFMELLRLIKERHGFCKEEIEVFRRGYEKFDQDGSGEMSADELKLCLEWLGITPCQDMLERLVAEVDEDLSGSLSLPEFFRAMRKYREKEVHLLSDLFRKHQAKCMQRKSSSNRAVHGITDMFQQVGYTVTRGLLQELCSELDLKTKPPGFEGISFEDFWRLLQETRRCATFLKEELAEFNEAFQRFDRDGGGDMCTVELGGLLRWLGYRRTLQQQQALLAEVDIDRSGKLDFREVVQLLRRIREQEVAQARQIFDTFDYEGALSMDVEDLESALRSQGHMEAAATVAQAVKERGLEEPLDFNEYLCAVRQCRVMELQKARQNAGFSDEDLERFHWQFGKYDKDSSGTIVKGELQAMFVDLFPSMTDISGDQAHLAQMMRRAMLDADSNEDGELDFADFLALMRRIQDMKDQAALEREKQVIAQIGFVAHDVETLRSVFTEYDQDMSGDLSASEIAEMLAKVSGGASEQCINKITKLFKDSKDLPGRPSARSETFDFPSFLQFCKKMQDANMLPLGSMRRISKASTSKAQ